MPKRIFSAVLSILLALSISIQEPGRILAAAIPQYVKEIKIATGTSKSEAISVLKAGEYTVVDCNLREGTGGSYCYMGYKTTTDESEAITDVRLMNAGGGISEVKYRDLAAKWKKGIETSGEYFKEACLEVKANYNKKSPLAEAAVKLLDIFEVDGEKLSSYLFSDARTDEDYQDILLICADNVVSVIYSALYMGTADCGADNFATRLQNVNSELFDYDYIEAQKDNATYIGYWTDTARIISQLQTFAEEYDEAVEFFEKYEPENDTEISDETEISEEDLCDYWRDFVDDSYKNSTDTEEQELYQHASVMGIYEKLEGYTPSFSDAYNNLAEYIYECGNPFDENGEESDLVCYRIYPLVSALTQGQIFTLQYGGLSALVSALNNNDESYENQTSAAVDEIKEKIAENGLERISVFYNVNREVYNQTVAFTDEAHRIATASSEYESLTREESQDELTQTLTDIILIGGMVAGAILAATVVYLGVCAFAFGTTATTLLSVGYLAILSGSVAFASGGMTLTTTAIVTGIIGVGAAIVAALVLSVLVICALIGFFKNLFGDDDEETIVYPDMPAILYDVTGTKLTQYSAVTDVGGALVDINGGNGTQWDGLYYTHSKNAGSPIKADGDAFTFSQESYVAPEGAVAIKRFGYASTANFNTYKKNSDKPLYLFFSSEESEQDTGNTYLYDLQLLSGDSTEEVCLGLIEKNYTVLEQNLTPNSKTVTYLGYKTTDDADEAITDIRIAYYYDAEKFVYGTTAKGTLAEYALVGQLNTKASLYYVKQASNGSPILADFRVTEELLDASSGYEPVNLFSGGNAFNLIIGSDSYSNINALKKSSWSKSLYLYFRPSEAYTSGTEYISGFAFSSDFDDNLEFAEQCGFKPVESLKNYDLTSKLSEQTTHLLYSTTYNPYRAITEIRTYTAQNSCDSVLENISVGTTGYAVCETFACIKEVGMFSTDYYRLLRPSNSFISRHSFEGGCDTHVDAKYQVMNNLGKYEEIPQTGLYVAGPSPTTKPLTMDEIFFGTSKGDATRTYFDNSKGERISCRPASELTDCYTSSAKNLTMERYWYISGESERVRDVDLKNYLYIYYRGSVPTRGKYVSNIYITTVEADGNNDNYAADQAIAKALSYGEGELIKVNLSRKESNQPYTTEKITTTNNSYYYRDVYCSSSGTASYMFVTYTDYRIESMRGATRQWYDEDESTESKTLKYQSTTFTRGGDVVKGISGDYGIFTSSNGHLGSAITDVILDTDYLKAGCITISDSDDQCHIGEDYILKFTSGGNVDDVYYTDIVVASASSKDEAIKKLYQSGCNGFIDQNKNEGGGGKHVYIGYKATANADAEGVITGLRIVLNDSPIEEETEEWKNKVRNFLKRIGFNSETTDSEDDMEYTRVSGNLNEGVKGDYSYLYVSRSEGANPITRLTTTTIMESSLSTFKNFAMYDWTKTEDASSNSKANKYRLCYRQKSNDWTINENGELIISTNGDMKDYTDKRMITYSKPGMGGYRTYVEYYPEWSDYADAITSVVIEDGLTRLDDCAFRNCDSIEYVTIRSKNCVIEEGSIPEGMTIIGYANSTAEEYAATYGMTFVELSQYAVGTILGNGNILLVVAAVVGLGIAGAVAYAVKRKRKTADRESSEA